MKVAKWENAFNVAGGTASVKPVDAVSGLDMIDGDDDRFNVWVYDKAKWDAKTPHIKAKISTDNVVGFTQYNDPASEIDLVRRTDGARPPGWFWSDSQMLVSNAMDDTATIPGVGGDENPLWGLGAPKGGYAWHKADRTHRVALRGTVKAEYTPNVGPAVADTKAVPMRHYVNANVNIMNDDGNIRGAITKLAANEEFMRANEQYAQVGILLIPDIHENVNWPANVNLNNGLDCHFQAIDGITQLTAEEKSLMVQSTGSVDDIEIYYVNQLNDRNTNNGPRGLAVIAISSPSPKALYQDTAFINVRRLGEGPFVLPHEIGHILTDGVHYKGLILEVNLMRDTQTSSADTVNATKRLLSEQDNEVNSRRGNLLKVEQL